MLLGVISELVLSSTPTLLALTLETLFNDNARPFSVIVKKKVYS